MVTGPGPAPTPTGRDGQIADLQDQLAAARREVARTMARATRLSQVVAALGREDDPDRSLRDLAGGIAELFTSDVCIVLAEPDDRHHILETWGVPDHRVADAEATLPDDLAGASSADVEAWVHGLVAVAHVTVVRLQGRNRRVGLLVLGRCDDDPYDAEDARELTAVASRIALGAENAWLVRATQRHLTQVERLHAITRELSTPLSREGFVAAVSRIVSRELPGQPAAVYVAEPGQHRARWWASVGPTVPWPDMLPTPADASAPWLALDLGDPARLHGVLVATGDTTDEDRGLLRHLAEVGALVLERVALNERLQSQARTDPLTGLANRRTVMESLGAATARAHRSGRDLGLVFVDLDGFKRVNDRHGHAAGDDVLREVAARLRGEVRDGETVGRIGGDEFVVLCESVAGRAEVTAVADRLQAAINRPIPVAGTTVRVGASCGVATGRDDPERLLGEADAAMYRAKARHRPVVVY